MKYGLSIVDACLRAVVIYKPKFWCLENPVGKLTKYLGKPALIFQPCDYGDNYTKRTCLWGDFTPPVQAPVKPVCTQQLIPGCKSSRSKAASAVTPPGFAKAFFLSNP